MRLIQLVLPPGLGPRHPYPIDFGAEAASYVDGCVNVIC
jgi:hypothetical protein